MSSSKAPNDRDVDVTVGIPTRNRSRLLKRSIASVLRQSYDRFTLLVSDNASNDDTARVVASFDDPRLFYLPLERNIGRAANHNRLIELAETEYLVLTGDDDELHPDHLSLTIDALRRFPSAGVAHAGCAIVDIDGNALDAHHRILDAQRPVTFESGAQFIERSMKVIWTVCFPSAVFRRAALIGGGGLRPEDGVIDDIPLLLRIATDWDFAYLDRPLVTVTAHDDASSSSNGSFTPDGYQGSRSVPDLVYERRRRFLAEADIPEMQARRLTRIVERTYRREVLACLSMGARTGDGHAAVFRALAREIRRDPRMALNPMTGRFVVGQLGARRLRDGMRRMRSTASHRQ
jgi:glycosyltransferase involved in cell wall biosynthesis